MRLFFALEPPGETIRAIAAWRDRELPPCGRPVAAANFHVTLAFIGELPASRLERLCMSVDQWLAGRDMPGGRLLLDQAGYWPGPGIFWLGASNWPEQLSQLAARLGGLSSGSGGKRDKRRMQPHVTLFRRCNPAPPAPARVPVIPMPYDHFTLFESQRGRAGVSYHALQHWELPGD